MPHFDDHPTDTEPAGPASAPGGPGAAEPVQAPGVAPAPPASPVPLWPPPPPEWRPPGQDAVPQHPSWLPPGQQAAPQHPSWLAGGEQHHNGHPRPATGLSRFAGSAPLDVLGRPLASFFKRALAIAVDFLVLSFALSEFGHEVFPLVLSSANSKPPSGQLMEFLGVSALVWIGYLTLLGSSRRGQTIGMMLYGIAVRDDAGGGQVSVGRATLRSVILLGLSGFFVDLIWPLWDKKRQSLHDKAARTVVVDVRLAALAEQLRQAGR
ncbi:MAG: RDD family protein [Acidimicrobiales bacterium]